MQTEDTDNRDLMSFLVQVVCMLLTELVLLPIAHGYFVHMCAWPLVHSRPAIYFGISFVLLHWLMGMVSCRDLHLYDAVWEWHLLSLGTWHLALALAQPC